MIDEKNAFLGLVYIIVATMPIASIFVLLYGWTWLVIYSYFLFGAYTVSMLVYFASSAVCSRSAATSVVKSGGTKIPFKVTLFIDTPVVICGILLMESKPALAILMITPVILIFASKMALEAKAEI